MVLERDHAGRAICSRWCVAALRLDDASALHRQPGRGDRSLGSGRGHDRVIQCGGLPDWCIFATNDAGQGYWFHEPRHNLQILSGDFESGATIAATTVSSRLSACMIERLCHVLKLGCGIVQIRSYNHAAATTSCHVCMADALKARCALAEVR